MLIYIFIIILILIIFIIHNINNDDFIINKLSFLKNTYNDTLFEIDNKLLLITIPSDLVIIHKMLLLILLINIIINMLLLIKVL